jgi:WD40 repeat protein
MRCANPNCNAELSTGDQFCGECGQKVEVTDKCPRCGSKTTAGDAFCGKCGHKLQIDESEQPEETAVQPSTAGLVLFPGHTAKVNCISVSPNSRFALSASDDGTIRMWNLQGAVESGRLIGHIGCILSVAISPDGRYALSCSDDRTVRLWDIETAKEVIKFEGSVENITNLVFSPDGRLALSCGYENVLRLWEVGSGRELSRLEGHTEWVNCIAFSPDGNQALSGSIDCTVRLWDIQSREEMLRFGGETDISSVNCVAFSPDGKAALSCGWEDLVYIWDVRRGKELQRLEGHKSMVFSAAFSPDGSRIISGGNDMTIRLWDVESGRELRRYEDHNECVLSVAFTPDGHRFLSGGGDTWNENADLIKGNDYLLRLWDIERSGEAIEYREFAHFDGEVRHMEGHRDPVTGVVFSPDGKCAVSCSLGEADNSIRLWDVLSGRQIWIAENTVTLHPNSIGFSPDGQQVVHALLNHRISVYDLETGQDLRPLQGPTDIIAFMAFSPDGRLAVSCGLDKSVRIWDIAQGKELKQIEDEIAARRPIFSPDGSVIAAPVPDGSIVLWNAENGNRFLRLEGHEGTIFSVSFSPGGDRLISVSTDNTARVWDLRNGREINCLRPPEREFGEGNTREDKIEAGGFAPDGRPVVITSDGWYKSAMMQLLDHESGRQLFDLKGHTKSISEVVITADGRRAISCDSENSVRLWDLADGRELNSIEVDPEFESPVSLYRNGFHTVISWSDKNEKKQHVFDMARGRRLQLINESESLIAISYNGRFGLIRRSVNGLCFRDVEHGKEVNHLIGHNNHFTSIAFTQDGSRLVSGSSGGSLRVWDVATGSETNAFEAHTQSVNDVDLSVQGDLALSAGYDQYVRLWDISTGSELNSLKLGSDWTIKHVCFTAQGEALCLVPFSNLEDETGSYLGVWDVKSGKELCRLKANASYYKFSPDGKLIISLAGGIFQVWDSRTGKEMMSFQSHTETVRSIAISPDKTQIITGHTDHSLRLWRIPG